MQDCFPAQETKHERVLSNVFQNGVRRCDMFATRTKHPRNWVNFVAISCFRVRPPQTAAAQLGTQRKGVAGGLRLAERGGALGTLRQAHAGGAAACDSMSGPRLKDTPSERLLEYCSEYPVV